MVEMQPDHMEQPMMNGVNPMYGQDPNAVQYAEGQEEEGKSIS